MVFGAPWWRLVHRGEAWCTMVKAGSGGMTKWTITTNLGNSCTMPVRNWEIVNRWDQARPYYYSDCMFSEAEMDMDVYITAVMDEDMSDTNNATAIALKSDELGLQRVELVWTDDVKFFNNNLDQVHLACRPIFRIYREEKQVWKGLMPRALTVSSIYTCYNFSNVLHVM